MGAGMTLVPSPRWSTDELSLEADKSKAIFRGQRVDEPIEIYSDYFDAYRSEVENILEESIDLKELASIVEDYIVDDDKRYALRYLASPAISDDDLKVLAETNLSRAALRADPDAIARIIDTVVSVHDRWRFPWVSEGREPTEEERLVAVIATTSMIASSRAQTFRRNTSKKEQEEQVAAALRGVGFTEVPARVITNLREAPRPGEYCHESSLAKSKADIIVGLWDDRILAIEAKVSNSSTNSVKRINREAAAKATTWITKLGSDGVVPAAVISGVFKVHNLLSAQDDGLAIFWAHDLSPMLSFIESTR